MVQRRQRERSLFEVLLPDGHKLWPDWLRKIDTLLEDEAVIEVVAQALEKRWPQSRRRGRLGPARHSARSGVRLVPRTQLPVPHHLGPSRRPVLAPLRRGSQTSIGSRIARSSLLLDSLRTLTAQLPKPRSTHFFVLRSFTPGVRDTRTRVDSGR